MALNQYLHCCPSSSLPTGIVKFSELPVISGSQLTGRELFPLIQHDGFSYTNKNIVYDDLISTIAADLTQSSSYSQTSDFSVTASVLLTSSFYKQEYRIISNIDSSSGFFSLTQIPLSENVVELEVIGGGVQINSASMISSNMIADFKVSGSRVIFNDNFSTDFNLTGHLNINDEIIVKYFYNQYL
jgi:hypothetical protein